MQRVLIIAEAGVNHNGDINLAYRMIDSAKESGADIIKFQTFKAEKVLSEYAPKAKYQMNEIDGNESQLDMLKKLELDTETHLKLMQYCRAKEIEFLSTPFDIESVELLRQLGLKRFKIPSGEITNYPLLREIAQHNLQVILSTGMSNLGDIERALDVLESYGTERENIILLHCNTEYPTPFEDVNLNVMSTMQYAFELPVGYSDHSSGIEVPIAAVALGAIVIEKHFTLDRNLPGPDHKASLEPSELKAMVSAIRNIEKAMGLGVKRSSPSEINNMSIARKSIIAAKTIKKGEIFTENNITTKRPGDGISPMLWESILGRSAFKDFEVDERIEI